jgi:hypothetical protein
MRKKLLIYSAIIVITTVSFLFYPKPPVVKGPNSGCVITFISLNSYTGFPMNCDALEFTGSSVNPAILFQTDYHRQSRPIYIVSGNILGNVMFFITKPFHTKLEKIAVEKAGFILSQKNKNEAVRYLSHYAGLVLLNFILLLLSLIIFSKIITHFTGEWKNGTFLYILLLLFLVSNHVTKLYFWTPHQQMFNILVPLLCIYISILIQTRNYGGIKLFLAGFVCGSLVLLYGSFLLLLPVILFSLLINFKSNSSERFGQLALKMLSVLIAFILPTAIWAIILRLAGTEFISSEIKNFRQFVWVFDALKDPGRSLLNEMYQNLIDFIKTTSSLILPLFLLIIILLTNPRLKKNSTATSVSNNLTAIYFIVTILIFLFFYLLGYYTDRLTFSLVPVIIVFTALRINSRKISPVLKFSICSIIILWHIFIVLYEMPHFSDRYYY